MKREIARCQGMGLGDIFLSMNSLFSSFGSAAPTLCVVLFLAASLLAVIRLEALSRQGVEGSVLGTIFMPFFSGVGNIAFAVILATHKGDGNDVLTNCLFNNMANLTLLIGVPMLIWSMSHIPDLKVWKEVSAFQISRLSTKLNITAVFFFTLFLLLLSRDGYLSREDGWILILLFVFWQCFQVYDVKKTNLLKRKTYPRTLPMDIIILLVCSYFTYATTDYLVEWFQGLDPDRVSPRLLGWLSGVLMVLPNALLAIFYGSHRRMDIVYASQVGDAHVCVPLCVGLFVVLRPFEVGAFLLQSLLILMGLFTSHLIFVMIIPRFSRVFAALFIAVFCLFVWAGLFR